MYLLKKNNVFLDLFLVTGGTDLEKTDPHNFFDFLTQKYAT